MNSNKFFTGAILALLLIAAIPFASVNPKLQLQNYSMSESPAQAGHVIALTLNIKSLESDNCAERVAVQVATSYPLSVQGPDVQYLEKLCFQDPDSAGVFTFLLPIDNLASSGTYPVSISTTYEKRFTKLSESNTINVRVGGSPSFDAAIISSNPVDIYPGDDAKISVTIQNTGSSMVQSAKATAVSSGINVKWASAEQVIGQIQARSSSTAFFSIEAPKNLKAGSYPLEIKLDYIGEDRQNGTVVFNFEIPVKEKAEFEAGFSSKSTLHSGSAQQTEITITNTGTQEAKKIKVRIKPIFPFSTDGTIRYIESLPPGKSEVLTYILTVDKDATDGSQLSGINLEFEDPQGKKFSDSVEFAIPVRPANFIEGLEPFFPYIWFILLVAVFALGKNFLPKQKKKE